MVCPNSNKDVIDTFHKIGLLDTNLSTEEQASQRRRLYYIRHSKDNGINGGICNLIYFKKPLTALNVYFLYNMIKNKTPPVTNDSNLTIMKRNFKTLSNSYDQTYEETF